MSRFLDFSLAVLGLVILFPLFIIVSLLILADSRGPVFYRQIRVGLHREPFKIYKFRTMVRNADFIGDKITVKGDSRVTGIGKILRRYKIDELPQLLNVIMGDMSLVGPRPEVPEYANILVDQDVIYTVKPGMTDPASVTFKNESEMLCLSNLREKYENVILPQKVKMNIDYIKRKNVLNDLKLIFTTIAHIFN